MDKGTFTCSCSRRLKRLDPFRFPFVIFHHQSVCQCCSFVQLSPKTFQV
uniref:Uncharacterized protein n=1 Tax=Arundo donax TaxID=35708 RepID=A0A0A9EW82_ARUDO